MHMDGSVMVTDFAMSLRTGEKKTTLPDSRLWWCQRQVWRRNTIAPGGYPRAPTSCEMEQHQGAVDISDYAVPCSFAELLYLHLKVRIHLGVIVARLFSGGRDC